MYNFIGLHTSIYRDS